MWHLKECIVILIYTPYYYVYNDSNVRITLLKYHYLFILVDTLVEIFYIMYFILWCPYKILQKSGICEEKHTKSAIFHMIYNILRSILAKTRGTNSSPLVRYDFLIYVNGGGGLWGVKHTKSDSIGIRLQHYTHYIFLHNIKYLLSILLVKFRGTISSPFKFEKGC